MTTLSILLIAAAGVVNASGPLAFPSALGSACPPPLVAKCEAPLPEPGQIFHGVVLQVMDGNTLCVASGPLPTDWVEIQIDQSSPAAGRGAVMAAAFGKRVDCRSTGGIRSDVKARCTVDGVDLNRLVDSAAIRQEGAAWR